MAGVLLLVSKNKNADLEQKVKPLRQYIDDNFKSEFKDIKLNRPQKDHLLIEFRKNDYPKYFSDEKGNWLTYSGHVFDLSETRRYDAKSLWELYKKIGKKMPGKLDGHFVIKLYDAEQDELLVINDFIKNRSEFLCETEDYIIFTPFSVLSAAIREPQPDWQALNEYMWRYYILSERSLLRDVSRLPMASLYSIKNGELKRETYWKWPRSYTNFSFEQEAEKLSASMQESARLAGTFDEKPVIELTLGQDSRQVAAGFTSQQIPFTSAIYGKENFYEVIKVKEMTARQNIENRHIVLGEDYLSDPWYFHKKGILLSSAEEPGYIIGRILYMRSQYRDWSSLAINGVHGRYYKDGLWNEMYVLNLYREPRRFDLNKLLKLRVMNKNYRDDIFNYAFRLVKDQSAEYFKEMTLRSIAGLENSPMAIQVDKFDTDHYGNFGLVGNTGSDFIIDLISPLLLRRNMELALTMPVSWKYNLSKIQRAVVSRLDEKLAAEITSFGEINMLPKQGIHYLPFIMNYWFNQSKKYRDKIKNKMGMSVTTQLQKAWDYLPAHKNTYKNGEVQELLRHNDMALNEVLDKNQWQNFLAEFEHDKEKQVVDYEYLFKILSVEYLLKKSRELWQASKF